jgi:hypothetical protein
VKFVFGNAGENTVPKPPLPIALADSEEDRFIVDREEWDLEDREPERRLEMILGLDILY